MIEFQTVNDAFNEAESLLRNADRCAARAVEFAAGRLRSMELDAYTLRRLKQELQNFNAKRGKWRAR